MLATQIYVLGGVFIITLIEIFMHDFQFNFSIPVTLRTGWPFTARQYGPVSALAKAA